MNITQEQIYNLTNMTSKSRVLTKILIRAYRDNLDRAYEVLVALPSEEDRLRLLKYLNKLPRLSAHTVKKIVDTYMFYRVTLRDNPVYKKIYTTNNPRCTEHQSFHQMRKFKIILERAFDYDLERVQKVLEFLPNEQDRLKLLQYIDKTPHLSNKTVKKMVQLYLIYNVDLHRPNQDRRDKPTDFRELIRAREERDAVLSYWASLNFISQR